MVKDDADNWLENSEWTKPERYLFFHNRGLFTLQISHQQQAPANKGAKKLNTYSGWHCNNIGV